MNTGSSILKPFNKLWDAVGRSAFKCIPNTTVNTPEICNRIGATLSRPDVNRAIMGATAIVSQPFIDYYNPNVDEDTAKTSTCRTIGKIVAGTTVGCVVRSMCYYATKAFTSTDPKAPKWRRAMLPSTRFVHYLDRKFPDWIKNYRNGLSTMVGLTAMLFTNVLIDVPLTNKITHKLLNAFNLKGSTNKPNPQTQTPPQKTDGNQQPNNPRQNIADSFEHLHSESKGGGQ